MAVPPAGAVRHVVAAVRLAGGGMKVEGLIGQNGVFVVGHAVQVLAGDVFRIDADHEVEGIEQAHSRPQRLFQAAAMLLEGRRHVRGYRLVVGPDAFPGPADGALDFRGRLLDREVVASR